MKSGCEPEIIRRASQGLVMLAFGVPGVLSLALVIAAVAFFIMPWGEKISPATKIILTAGLAASAVFGWVRAVGIHRMSKAPVCGCDRNR